MEARLQRRVQRWGWDLAVARYESLWSVPLAPAHEKTLALAAPAVGEHVIDVACGTGVVALAAARAVGPAGAVVGVDISGRMVQAAAGAAMARGFPNATFERMEAESLAFATGSFDVATCALGLMYVNEPLDALREMHRVLHPGGRAVLAVWGDRARCGWAPLLEIVDAEVRSDVCPLFFALGRGDALARSCTVAGFGDVETFRIPTTLRYDGANDACSAAFVAGPVALAWSRFSDETRERVCDRYVESIDRWRGPDGYRIPGEFVVVRATRR